jgi:hypothetical protein
MFSSNVALPNAAFERTRRPAQLFPSGGRWRRAAQLGRWAAFRASQRVSGTGQQQP